VSPPNPFRDRIRDMCPTWLREGRLERLMYTFGLGLDLLAEKAVQAAHAANPTKCDVSALPLIGSDLLIQRGATELESRYRERLQHADESWQHAGTPWLTLQQALHLLLELRPAARMVSSRYDRSAYPATIVDSKWNVYAAGEDADAQPPTRVLIEPGNWDWDSFNLGSGAGCWSRTWVVIESVAPNDWCHPAPFQIGDADMPKIGERSWSIGFAEPPFVFTSLLETIELWRAGNARNVNLIVSFDATHFDPAEPAGGGINPDGQFGCWSRMDGVNQVPARDSITGARYCAVVAE
jgi:hypothetical protein